jgi:hypothetical protein
MSEVTGSPNGARARTVIFLSVVANAAQDVGEPAVRPSAAESLRLTALGHGRRETRSIKVTATDGQPQLQRLIPAAAQIAKIGRRHPTMKWQVSRRFQ